MRGRTYWLTGEPSLEDLLSDPVTHAVMAYDGITVDDVRAAVARARARLRRGSRSAAPARRGSVRQRPAALAAAG